MSSRFFDAWSYLAFEDPIGKAFSRLMIQDAIFVLCFRSNLDSLPPEVSDQREDIPLGHMKIHQDGEPNGRIPSFVSVPHQFSMG